MDKLCLSVLNLYDVIDKSQIVSFQSKELVRPHVVCPNLKLAYSQMSKDKKLETEALDWAEMAFEDIVRNFSRRHAQDKRGDQNSTGYLLTAGQQANPADMDRLCR